MNDIIQVEDRYYILATSDRAAECLRVLKEGDTFALFDCHGDIQRIGLGEQGIYHEGTRFLSGMELRFAGERPLLLGSSVTRQNDLLAVDLMNPDYRDDGHQVRRDSVHVYRSKFIWKGTCFEQLRVTNFSLEEVDVPLAISFAADFADIFEVRGTGRKARGTCFPPLAEESSVTLAYEGLDGITRSTSIQFSPPPLNITSGDARYRFKLKPRESACMAITVDCSSTPHEGARITFEQALPASRTALCDAGGAYCGISSDSAQFNALLERSRADLVMMTSCTAAGPYPYAGVPWFSTPFGRDGIITALETLWVNPELARGVLMYLAATQAEKADPAKDADPGKILHEARHGEMANLGEIPFGSYYGSVDSTPLFVVLAGAYAERTGDLEFIRGIWPNVLRALEWIDSYGDADGDGFVEYARRSSDGLLQQGWKDSDDSVFHRDGTLAPAPIALCEVQGYVYQARLMAAGMAAALGDAERAAVLGEQARWLRDRFQATFWSDELSFFALALDGQKRPCLVRSSNAGHCLYSGLATQVQASAMANHLLSDLFFTGWGVRTIASNERRYNPMAYHNGSIWPHDNALVAAGLARYGHTAAAVSILEGIFQASMQMDLHRLPELFCGFKRREEEAGPIRYPMACAPQAWAAASVYLMLQSCMGLAIDGERKWVHFRRPVLPHFINELTINGMRVGGGASLDVVLRRFGGDVAVSVSRKDPEVEVRITK